MSVFCWYKYMCQAASGAIRLLNHTLSFVFVDSLLCALIVPMGCCRAATLIAKSMKKYWPNMLHCKTEARMNEILSNDKMLATTACPTKRANPCEAQFTAGVYTEGLCLNMINSFSSSYKPFSMVPGHNWPTGAQGCRAARPLYRRRQRYTLRKVDFSGHSLHFLFPEIYKNWTFFPKQCGHTCGSYGKGSGLVLIRGGLIRARRFWRPLQHKSSFNFRFWRKSRTKWCPRGPRPLAQSSRHWASEIALILWCGANFAIARATFSSL